MAACNAHYQAVWARRSRRKFDPLKWDAVIPSVLCSYTCAEHGHTVGTHEVQIEVSCGLRPADIFPAKPEIIVLAFLQGYAVAFVARAELQDVVAISIVQLAVPGVAALVARRSREEGAIHHGFVHGIQGTMRIWRCAVSGYVPGCSPGEIHDIHFMVVEPFHGFHDVSGAADPGQIVSCSRGHVIQHFGDRSAVVFHSRYGLALGQGVVLHINIGDPTADGLGLGQPCPDEAGIALEAEVEHADLYARAVVSCRVPRGDAVGRRPRPACSPDQLVHLDVLDPALPGEARQHRNGNVGHKVLVAVVGLADPGAVGLQETKHLPETGGVYIDDDRRGLLYIARLGRPDAPGGRVFRFVLAGQLVQ